MILCSVATLHSISSFRRQRSSPEAVFLTIQYQQIDIIVRKRGIERIGSSLTNNNVSEPSLSHIARLLAFVPLFDNIAHP